MRTAIITEDWHLELASGQEDNEIPCRHLQGSIAISYAIRSHDTGEHVRRNSFHRLLLSLLVAISMVAGFGRAASAAAPTAIVLHQHAPDMNMSAASHAGHMMHAPVGPQPAPPHHHHDLAGCACCSMACCSAVLPSPALVGAVQARASVAYAALLVSGHGVTAALEPDPPRPSTL